MKHLKRLLAVLIVAVLALTSNIAVFAEDGEDAGLISANGEAAVSDEAAVPEESGEWHELDMTGHDIAISLPPEYFFCYDKNVTDYRDYFESIGWDYDDTVKTFDEQGIEIFAFNQDMSFEFYYIEEDKYDDIGTESLSDYADDITNSPLYDYYYGSYFGQYSLYDLYSVEAKQLNGMTYVAATFVDYNDSSKPVPVAEYWTALNGKTYHFMLYGANTGEYTELCLEELERIMDKVQFTKVLSEDELKAEKRAENRKEIIKWVLTVGGTVAAIAIIVAVIVIIGKRRHAKASK